MATDTTQTTSPPELATMRIEVEGNIGTLTLDRPDALNAMSPEMIGEMTDRLRVARRPRAAARPDRHRLRRAPSRPAAT